MKYINNRLDKSFGISMLFPGILFIIFGLVFIIFSYWTIILVIIGALIAFSHTGVKIDIENKRVMFYQNFFGIIKSGKWETLEKYIGLTHLPMNHIHQVKSLSNRSTSIVEKDFRIFLVNKSKKPEFPLKKCKTKEEAQREMDILAIKLQLPVYS